MEMPEAKWLKPYSVSVVVVSILETGLIVPGNLFVKLTLSAFSFMSIFLGFAIGVFILSFCFLLPKITGSEIRHQHRQNSRDIANLLFVLGIIGPGIILFIYPMIGTSSGLPFSPAPAGAGMAIGANWIWKKCHLSNPFFSSNT